MKRKLLVTLMISLLLAGCSRQDTEKFLARREELRSADLSFDAAVRCITERGETAYSAACSMNGEKTRFTILSPASEAGITISCETDGAELAYEGTVLVLPRSAVTGDDPCAAIPKIAEALYLGRFVSLGPEGDETAALFDLGNGRSVRLRFNEAWVPTCAEYSAEGRVIAYCTITNWCMGEK